METKKTYKILTILLIMQWAFIQLIAQFPDVIEKYYSTGLYIYISKFLRSILGWIPFSVGDLLYLALILLIGKTLFKLLKFRNNNVKNMLFKMGGICSVIFFLFNLNWGLNYFRVPLYKTLNIEKTTYSNDELFAFTKKLITKINNAHLLITHNDTVLVTNTSTKKEIMANAENVYKELQEKFPQFKYVAPSKKHSLFSIPLTYMGFGGYLNPITGESQINSLIPKNNYSATICHEIAHQLGIASESEANFVGYLATTNSKDLYFNYSGYLMAMRYCISEIYRKDPSQFEELKKLLNKGILKDMQQSQDFWKSYQNWTEKYFKTFYDSYLKANKQKDGIRGYNKMVTLLINYHKTTKL